MAGATYAYYLLYNTKTTIPKNSTDASIFLPQPYFKEYKFQGTCKYPNCPTDYETLYDRSRFPDLPDFQNGSLLHSSVYMYSKELKTSVRNDSLWNSFYSKTNGIRATINGLSYMDLDLQTAYAKGPATTVMFYVSAQVYTDLNSYVSIHRTFPGIIKNSTSYDPPSRSWFANAPENAVYLYGPYRETFTKQLVLTLSSSKSKRLYTINLLAVL